MRGTRGSTDPHNDCLEAQRKEDKGERGSHCRDSILDQAREKRLGYQLFSEYILIGYGPVRENGRGGRKG